MNTYCKKGEETGWTKFSYKFPHLHDESQDEVDSHDFCALRINFGPSLNV